MEESQREQWAKIFGENVRRLREKEGISVAEFAKYLHISQERLTRLEEGVIDKRLSMSVVFAIAGRFHLKEYQLFERGDV